MNIENLKKELELAIIPGSTIAVSSDYKDYAEYQKFINQLLVVLKDVRLPLSIMHFARVLGSSEELNGTLNELLSDIKEVGLFEPIHVILLAIPKTFKDKDGLEYFIGTLDNNDIEALLPFNAFLNETLSFPEEFVLGYITSSPSSHGTLEFKLNEHYIGVKSEEEQIAFFEKIKKTLLSCGVEIINGYGNNVVFFKRDIYHKQLEMYLVSKDSIVK